VQKLRVNENKQTEYAKKLMKEKSPLELHGDREKKCNSMIRTMGEDRAWWDKQYGNQIPSPRHE